MSRLATKSLVLMVALVSLPAVAADAPNPRFFSISLKGGAGTFTGDLNTFSKWSPTWGLGLGFQFTNWLGLEVSYDGSRHRADLSSVGVVLPATAFWRNGGTAFLKFSAPLGVFRPFVGGGFGVFANTPTNSIDEVTTAFRTQNDLYFEAPVGGGLEFSVGMVVFGVRGTYRFLVGTDFIQRGTQSVNGGFLDLQGTLGLQF